MGPVIITLLQSELVVTTMVIFPGYGYSHEFKMFEHCIE